MGRLIPQQFNQVNYSKTYGAFYPLIIKKENGSWKIHRFDYIPYAFENVDELNISAKIFD